MTSREQQLKQGFIAALLLFISSIGGLTAFTLWQLRSEAIVNGLHSSAMHTRGFEDFLTQNLHVTELIAANLDVQTPSPQAAERHFIEFLRRAPFLRSMSLLGADGRIYASSNPANIGIKIDTYAFLPPSSQPTDILRIGRPWEGRDYADGRETSHSSPAAQDSHSFIPALRTMQLHGRTFTLLFAINPDYFVNHVLHKLPPEQGSAQVLLYDGTLLLDTKQAIHPGSMLGPLLRKLHLPETEVGEFESVDLDSHPELSSFRASTLYPLVVITHLDRDVALEPWRTSAMTLLSAVDLVLLVVIFISIAYYRRQMQIAVQRTEIERQQRLNARVFESSTDAIAITDANARILSVNPAFSRITGYSPEEVIGKNPVQLLPADTIAHTFNEHIQSQLLEHGVWQGEIVNHHKDGHRYDLELSIAISRDASGDIQHFIAIGNDITARKRTEAELHIAATAFDTQDGIIVTDADANILRVNKAFTQITGFEPGEVVGQNPRILKSGRHDTSFYSSMWHSINTTGSWTGEIWNRRKSGDIYPERLTISVLKKPDGQVSNYVASIADITVHKAAEEEIRSLAFYDPLTGLPNRRLMLDRLQQALASCNRSEKYGSILFIDLDNFKALNDTLGHDKGDVLLQQVAHRLELCVRKGDTVARLGGDEFVVILEELSTHPMEAASQTETVGHKILEMLNKPYLLAIHDYHNSPSIGATLFSRAHNEIEELLKQADIAMYQAKKAGRNRLQFFDPEMQDSLNSKAALEDDLRKSLTRAQFSLYYQVQVDENHRALGAEALIRWIHPTRGMVAPDQFIPLAEETGLILPIGEWVLENACAQLKTWEGSASTRDLFIAINVSAKQFHQPDFVEQVRAAIRHHAIAPSKLKLELTESMLLENVSATISTMGELKQLGVMLSLDDFGTGYSSLQYLKRLPLDQFKIDKSFVRDLSVSSSDRAIVQSIIAMAHSLELDVIAEGVETREQCDFLMKHGCAHYQGYLFGKPLPIAQFESALLTLSTG